MAECFPRTTDLPTQSPLFWVTHKDRYLRQQLIRDIESDTSRSLIVYFTDCDRTNAGIDHGDDVYLGELFKGCGATGVDLLLETNGGVTDATEKICSMLRAMVPDLRVIVPRRAKSNGTVIALCGASIIMGPISEMGPIDPAISGVPVEFILGAPPGSFNAIEVGMATSARDQTRKLAKQLLSTGMLATKTVDEIDALIETIATKNHFHSHGSVMDMHEAEALGLSVIKLRDDDTFWRKLWLLRTMYSYDCAKNGYSKIFEGNQVSSAVTVAP